jgi:transposase-like protein
MKLSVEARVRAGVKAVLKEVLKEEMAEHLKVGYRELTPTPGGVSSNGYYQRNLLTLVRKIAHLEVPRETVRASSSPRSVGAIKADDRGCRRGDP